MPAKNELKTYVADGYYHLYNRGVEKRIIYLDTQDYAVFLHFLKLCLSPLPPPDPEKITSFHYKNLFNKVNLLCFVLMPNHFHLFVQQRIPEGIEILMRSIITRYVKYFNRKYHREGHLFQGRYKAIRIESEPHFLHLSRYIHLNPSEIWGEALEMYPYSSYAYYLGRKKADWLNTQTVLSFFTSHQKGVFSRITSYKSFVEDYVTTLEIPEDVRIDD